MRQAGPEVNPPGPAPPPEATAADPGQRRAAGPSATRGMVRSPEDPVKLALTVIAALAAGLAAACFLLPERFAVNAPITHMLFGRGAEPPPQSEFQQRVSVPQGFSIDFYATGIRNARLLRFTSTGDLLVTTPPAGAVMLLEADADGDGRADAVRTLLEGLDRPHGLDFHEGWLYVAEGGAVGRIRFEPETGAVLGSYERV